MNLMRKSMTIKPIGKIVLILSILLNLITMNISAQNEQPQGLLPTLSIEAAAQLTMETLSSPDLQELSIDGRILLSERLVRTSLGIPNHLTLVENVPISVLIGMFYSNEAHRHFMYFYTKEQEKYRKQSFPLGWTVGSVLSATCRKTEEGFLMELLLSVGNDITDWSMVDMYTLRWDGKSWQEVWHLDTNYEEVLTNLNVSSRFGIPTSDCYKQHAELVDFDREGTFRILKVTCSLLAGDFLPSANPMDTIDSVLVFVQDGDKYVFNSAWVKPSTRNSLREFLWLLRCGAITDAEKLVLDSFIVGKAGEWGLDSLDNYWLFIDQPAQVLSSEERNAVSNLARQTNSLSYKVGGEDSLLFWAKKPPAFIAFFEESNSEYKLANIQIVEDLKDTLKENTESYVIHKSTLIKIDGITDTDGEWQNIEYKRAKFVPSHPENWNGEDDLSGRVKGAFSDDKLYFAVEITDNILLQEWNKSNIWKGDHVELLLDTNLVSDAGTTKVDDDDFQIGISPGNFDTMTPEAYCWVPENKNGSVPRSEVAASMTNDGYIIEVGIPFEFLQIKPETGSMVGFTLLISDTDQKDASQKCMISIFPEFKYSDPTTWSILKFMD